VRRSRSSLPRATPPPTRRPTTASTPDSVDRQFRDVGQWWFKEHELDVLGLTDGGLVAGECRFTSQPVSEGVLADLERTASEVRWSDGPADGETLYVLFTAPDTLTTSKTLLTRVTTSNSSGYPI
jgi:hypothetical protein